MKTITIHCGSCGTSFPFRHPSVKSAKDVMGITLDCSGCGVSLKAPNDEVRMISIQEYMARSIKDSGLSLVPKR